MADALWWMAFEPSFGIGVFGLLVEFFQVDGVPGVEEWRAVDVGEPVCPWPDHLSYHIRAFPWGRKLALFGGDGCCCLSKY